MKKVPRLRSVSTTWFFSAVPWYVRCTTLIFIKGDAIFIAPIIVGLLLLLVFTPLQFAVMMIGFYLLFRYLGEMIYWLLQQFSPRTYCPPRLGFEKLDNHALYIVYQTFALLGMMVGVGLVCFSLLYLS